MSYLCATARWSTLLAICTLSIHAQGTVRDEVVFFHTNTLGSAVAAVSEQGELCWNEVYSPYGEKGLNHDSFPSVGCGLLAEERGYTGHTQDFESGLVYAQQRYYDPSIGRFLSIDPSAINSKDVRSINRYSYAANNPYRFTDPSGMVIEITITRGIDDIETPTVTLTFYDGSDSDNGDGDSSGSGTDIDHDPAEMRPGARKYDWYYADNEDLESLEVIHELAEKAAAQVDLNCTGTCKLPWIRGTRIHKVFADSLRALGTPYNAEISYYKGQVVTYGTKDSSRADATFGSISNPKYVVDLKTGRFGYMSYGEIQGYFRNLPSGTSLYRIRVP